MLRRLCAGGPEGDRTLGLCVANAALSQLSYEPIAFKLLTEVNEKNKCPLGLYKIDDSVVAKADWLFYKVSEPASVNLEAVKPAQLVVPMAGVEPARCCHQRILSPSRPPIPSHRHIFYIIPQRAGACQESV